MLTAIQFDIFGSERAADPTGRRRSLAEHTERCNLCCIPFDNAELPPVGHFFYLGFHICERCHTAFTEAEEDKRNERKIVRWRNASFAYFATALDPDRYISKHKDAFLVRLPADAEGKRRNVGRFWTMEEARKARDEVMGAAPGVIAVVIDNIIAGFIGNARNLTALIGRSIAGMEHNPITSESVIDQLLDLALDTGIIKEDALINYGYRYDNMIAEMYDNISYNRLNFGDIKEG